MSESRTLEMFSLPREGVATSSFFGGAFANKLCNLSHALSASVAGGGSSHLNVLAMCGTHLGCFLASH